MSATIGSLLVDMALNTASFASDLGKSKGALDSWAASHNRVLAGVAHSWGDVKKEMHGFIEEAFSLKTALLALVGGGLIGELVKSNLESAASMVDHANAIGITTDQLQEYQYAAKMSGVSSETLTGALEKFGKQVGLAQAGQGSLYTYLKATNTGLLEQITHAKSVDQAFTAVLKAMGSYDTQVAKLGLSSAAFSKGGLEMVNMVHHGYVEFEELRKKAQELGIVVGHDLLINAKGAQDQMETLGMIIKSKLMVAVISNAKEIDHFIEIVIEAMPRIMEFGEWILTLVNRFLDFKQAIREVKGDLSAFGALAHTASMQIQSIFPGGPTEGDIEKYKKEFASRSAANNGGGDFIGPFNPNGNSVPAAIKAAAGDNPAIPKGGVDSQGMIDALKAQEEAAAKADAAYKKLEASAKKTFEETRTPLEKYNIEMSKLKQELDDDLISQETYNRAVDQLGVKMHEAQNKGSLFFDIMDKGIHGNIKSWRDLGSAVVAYAQNLLLALATGQQSTSTLGIGSLLGSAASIFGSAASSSFIGPSQPGMLASAGSYIASFFHSGGMVGGAGGSSRRVDAGVFANAPRMHGGGLVGGEVPIIAKHGERVLTEQQQRSMGGVTYNIDARGADAGVEERIRNAMLELSGTIEPRAVRAVTQARYRNPQMFSGAA